MSTSNELIVGPNKKTALKFLVVSPFLIALGCVLFLEIIPDTYSVMGMKVTPKVAGIICLVVSLLPVATFMITHKTSKRLCLSREGITFPTREFVEWNQIADCEVTRFGSMPITIIVELLSGKKMAVSWAWVDCGMDHLCERMNEYAAAARADTSRPAQS